MEKYHQSIWILFNRFGDNTLGRNVMIVKETHVSRLIRTRVDTRRYIECGSVNVLWFVTKVREGAFRLLPAFKNRR